MARMAVLGSLLHLLKTIIKIKHTSFYQIYGKCTLTFYIFELTRSMRLLEHTSNIKQYIPFTISNKYINPLKEKKKIIFALEKNYDDLCKPIHFY